MRSEEDWLVKRIVESDMRGVRLRGSARTGWMNGVKRALKESNSVEQERMIYRDRN